MKTLLAFCLTLLLVGCISPSPTTVISYEMKLKANIPSVAIRRIEFFQEGMAGSTGFYDADDQKNPFTGSFLIFGTKKNFITVRLQDKTGKEWEEVYCLDPKLLEPIKKWTEWVSPSFKDSVENNHKFLRDPRKYFTSDHFDGLTRLKFMIQPCRY